MTAATRSDRHRSRGRELFLAWLPALLGVFVIIIESTESFSSAHTSGPLHRLWEALFGPLPEARWDEIHHIIRKTGHFVGYGTLSLLFYRAWRRTAEILQRQSYRLQNVLYALACTLIVAAGDEYHQTFLPGRTGRVQDVGIDMVGACTLQLLFWLVMVAVGMVRSRSMGDGV